MKDDANRMITPVDQGTFAAYEQHAAQFARDWHKQPAPADLHATVRRFFRAGLTADIGCGGGRDTAWLKQNGFPAVGFDSSEALLAEARRLYPDIRFRYGALPDLQGIEDAHFTNVLCETVIMHLAIDIVPPAVRRLVSLLQPGGTLYLSWRVTEGRDRRDEFGRLYASFAPDLVLKALTSTKVLLNETVQSQSSAKAICRIVARKEAI
jgi:SAM-dependent methyltransferase